MRGPGQPTLISANKLKTKYNINPQLDRIREDKFEAYRDIDSSSRVSLAVNNGFVMLLVKLLMNFMVIKKI